LGWRHRYDLILPAETLALPAAQALVEHLRAPGTAASLAALGGYDTRATGQLTWAE
jgi:hypothetical protein